MFDEKVSKLGNYGFVSSECGSFTVKSNCAIEIESLVECFSFHDKLENGLKFIISVLYNVHPTSIHPEWPCSALDVPWVPWGVQDCFCQ